MDLLRGRVVRLMVNNWLKTARYADYRLKEEQLQRDDERLQRAGHARACRTTSSMFESAALEKVSSGWLSAPRTRRGG